MDAVSPQTIRAPDGAPDPAHASASRRATKRGAELLCALAHAKRARSAKECAVRQPQPPPKNQTCLYWLSNSSTTALRCWRDADAWYSWVESKARTVPMTCVYAAAPASFLRCRGADSDAD